VRSCHLWPSPPEAPFPSPAVDRSHHGRGSRRDGRRRTLGMGGAGLRRARRSGRSTAGQGTPEAPLAARLSRRTRRCRGSTQSRADRLRSAASRRRLTPHSAESLAFASARFEREGSSISIILPCVLRASLGATALHLALAEVGAPSEGIADEVALWRLDACGGRGEVPAARLICAIGDALAVGIGELAIDGASACRNAAARGPRSQAGARAGGVWEACHALAARLQGVDEAVGLQ